MFEGGKKGKSKTIQDVAGDVPYEDESTQSDADEKEAYEIDFTEIFGIEKEIMKPQFCH